MTCIVGLAHENVVYVGGDSAGVDCSYNILSRGDEKVFMNDAVLMGGTTSFRMLQLLRYSLVVPEQSPKKTDMCWMVTDFVDAVRECFSSKGYMSKENDKEEGGSFLVAYNNKLYQVCDDFQVQVAVRGYDACGCGESYALGSLYTTCDWRDPVKRVRRALECASNMSAGVRPPFLIMNSRGEVL